MTQKQFIKNIIELGIKQNLSEVELADCIREAISLSERIIDKKKKDLDKKKNDKKILLKGDSDIKKKPVIEDENEAKFIKDRMGFKNESVKSVLFKLEPRMHDMKDYNGKKTGWQYFQIGDIKEGTNNYSIILVNKKREFMKEFKSGYPKAGIEAHEYAIKNALTEQKLTELARPLGSAKGGYFVIWRNKQSGAVRRESEVFKYEDAVNRANKLKQERGMYYDFLIKSVNENLKGIPSDREIMRKRGRPKTSLKISRVPHAREKEGEMVTSSEDDTEVLLGGEIEELRPGFKFGYQHVKDSEKWHWGRRLDIFGKLWPGYSLEPLRVKDLERNKSGSIIKMNSKSNDKATRITVKFNNGEEIEYIRDFENPNVENGFKKLWIVGGPRIKV